MYLYEGHQFVSKGDIKTLHFGAPNNHPEKLFFNPNQLLDKFENNVDLLLSFGGKRSPIKSSRYKLDFNKLNWNQPNKPNYLFSEIEENVLVVDKQKELGTTKEESLKKILGR